MTTTVAGAALVLALVSLAALGAVIVAFRRLEIELESKLDELGRDFFAVRGFTYEQIGVFQQALWELERREQKLVDQVSASVGVRVNLEEES